VSNNTKKESRKGGGRCVQSRKHRETKRGWLGGNPAMREREAAKVLIGPEESKEKYFRMDNLSNFSVLPQGGAKYKGIREKGKLFGMANPLQKFK